MKYLTKDVRFDVKSIDETGQFSGYASVYGNVDQGGDIVEPGAFTKSIKERGAEVPILWQHETGISVGLGTVEDSKSGLKLDAQLEMELPEAKSAYIRLKKKLVRGLSIGYKTIKSHVENGVRHITEAKLYEVSLVTFPMNEKALVSSVKQDAPMDFVTALDMIETMDGLCDRMQALRASLSDIIYDADTPLDEKVALADTTITQFHDDYIAFLPEYLAMMDEMTAENGGMVMYANIPDEFKAGRTLSAATRKRIEGAMAHLRSMPALPRITQAMTQLQALLDGGAAEKGTPNDPKAATQHSAEPGQAHSLLKLLEKELAPC